MESEKQYTAIVIAELHDVPSGDVSVKFATKEDGNKFIAQQFNLLKQIGYIVMSGYIISPDGSKEKYIDNDIDKDIDLYFRARSNFLSGYKIEGKFNNCEDEIRAIMIQIKGEDICDRYFRNRNNYIDKIIGEIPERYKN